MDHGTDVPLAIVDELRTVCLGLPEAVEEQAWVGTRWRVRGRTFAHVLAVESGWPPAYARAAGTDGPVNVLTFRSSGAEFDPRSFDRPPYFRPGWWPDIVGMVVDADTDVDWDEVAAHLIESYRLLAPRKLVDLVDPRT